MSDKTRIYEIGFVALYAEKKTVIAADWKEALEKAENQLAILNASLKKDKDNRYPDEIASIVQTGEIDE